MQCQNRNNGMITNIFCHRLRQKVSKETVFLLLKTTMPRPRLSIKEVTAVCTFLLCKVWNEYSNPSK